MLFVGVFAGLSAMAQAKSDDKPIEKVIAQFAQAADVQDTNMLDALLDANFRIVMNQLFGSSKVVVMDRNTYLTKIEKKEFGGDERKVRIHEIIQNGNTATARVSFIGRKMTFVSMLQFVKNKDGAWKVVNDMPVLI